MEKVTLFIDGASRGNPGEAAAGVLILDQSGEVLEEISQYLGITTNNVAEYQGAILGLSRAKDLKARKVQIYSDSQLLVRQLRGEYKVKSPHLIPLYRRVIGLINGFSEVRITHVPREENRQADRLANRGIDERAQSRTDGRSSPAVHAGGEGRKVRAP